MTADAQDRLAADVEALAAAFYESVAWEDCIEGRWTHDPRGLCGHLANITAGVVAEARAEERERIAQAIEARGKVCSDAHGIQCVGGIAYRDAADLARADREQQP